MLYNGIEKKVFLKLENILNTYFNTNTYILRILFIYHGRGGLGFQYTTY